MRRSLPPLTHHLSTITTRVSPIAPRLPSIAPTFRSRPPSCRFPARIRFFSANTAFRKKDKDSYASQAKELNKKGQEKQEDGIKSQLDDTIGEAKELQARTPWHREGSDQPPVKRNRSAGAMTKGVFNIFFYCLGVWGFEFLE
jgi:calcium uniporter protein, mitochondrial